MSIFDSSIESIEDGIKGLNKGLPMGLPRTTNIISDVQRARYDLIAGKTSAGKTAFVDQCYVINPLNYLLENDMSVTGDIKYDALYFCLEISPEDKVTKLITRKLHDEFGDYVDTSHLLSKGNNKIDPEIREKINGLKPYFDTLEERVHMYDAYTTAQEIINKVLRFAKENGTFKIEDGREVYYPNHPNHYVLLIVDTINLLTPSAGQSLFDAITKLSKKMIWFRNVCKFTPVILQQFNSNINDPLRVRSGKVDPIGDDLEDCKRPSKDCNTFLSVFDPFEAALKKHHGYDIPRMKGKYRQLQFIKNRDGERGGVLGLHFLGKIGQFNELPRPKPAHVIGPGTGEYMCDQDYENILSYGVTD